MDRRSDCGRDQTCQCLHRHRGLDGEAKPAAMGRLLRTSGKRKVLFGSDYPMMTPRKVLEGRDDLGLLREIRALFLGNDAERMYRTGA